MDGDDNGTGYVQEATDGDSDTMRIMIMATMIIMVMMILIMLVMTMGILENFSL